MSSWRLGARSSGRKSPLIVIEHLEDHFSLWIRAEYKHAKRIAGNGLVFTNLGDFMEAARENGLCPCYRESIVALRGVLYSVPERIIVLDPSADKLLSPEEAQQAEAIVIGGILGDNPPRGRTRRMLTEKLPSAKPRSLGRYQLSIDGAVYIAMRVVSGADPLSIPLVQRPRITISLNDVEVEIELPFAYPLVGSEPLVSEEVKKLLASGLGYEEYREMMRQGHSS